MKRLLILITLALSFSIHAYAGDSGGTGYTDEDGFGQDYGSPLALRYVKHDDNFIKAELILNGKVQQVLFNEFNPPSDRMYDALVESKDLGGSQVRVYGL